MGGEIKERKKSWNLTTLFSKDCSLVLFRLVRLILIKRKMKKKKIDLYLNRVTL